MYRRTISGLAHPPICWIITANGRYEDQAGRTIPVRFAVRRADGTLVEDVSVTVALLDGAGRAVAGPIAFGKTPADGIVFEGPQGYHGNLSTRGVAAGSYVLRARFDSPTLVGGPSPRDRSPLDGRDDSKRCIQTWRTRVLVATLAEALVFEAIVTLVTFYVPWGPNGWYGAPVPVPVGETSGIGFIVGPSTTFSPILFGAVAG